MLSQLSYTPNQWSVTSDQKESTSAQLHSLSTQQDPIEHPGLDPRIDEIQTPLNAFAVIAGDPLRGIVRSDIATTARPETHQNLIHTCKEHSAHDRDANGGPQRTSPDLIRGSLGTRRRAPAARGISDAELVSPLRHKAPDRLDTTHPVVEVIGLEPTTSCLQSRCSPS